MNILENLTQFTFSVSYEHVSGKAIEKAKIHLADSLACMIGSFNMPDIESVRDYAIRVSGSQDATLIGTTNKVPMDMAALVNGTMVRYLDANDIVARRSNSDSGHFSDAIPSLIAISEKYGRTGKDLLLATILVYELQAVLSETFQFMKRGYHPLSQVPWALPIVLGRLMGTSENVAVNATALSGTLGMPINTWLRETSQSIPSIKGMAVGMVGQRAIQSLQLAASGITGPSDSLETTLEILTPLSNESTNLDRLLALHPSQSEWAMERNTIKSYPSQIYTQAAIEAILTLYSRGLRADQIQSLTLYGHSSVCGGVQGSESSYTPQNRGAADHSTPFVMSMALLSGQFTLREYHDSPWSDPVIINLMSKIRLIIDPKRDVEMKEKGNLGVKLVATLINGHNMETVVNQPKGHPDNPFGKDDLLRKITWLLEDVASEDMANDILEYCCGIEEESDISRLLGKCVL